MGLFFAQNAMTYLSSKVWSDKARAAALAKRRGQAAPTTPQQSQTAEQAVAHANQLIASGILNKGKKGKGKAGKAGRGAGKDPKAKAQSAAEHAQRQKEHEADRAQRAADRETRQKEHTAAQAEHAKHEQEREADRAQRQQDRTQRQAEHQQQLAARQKQASDKAKAKAGAKPKAGGKSGSGKQPMSTAAHQAAIDKTNARANAHNARLQEKADKAKASADLTSAAQVLSTGKTPTPEQSNLLIGKGLAKRGANGALTLTPRGKHAAAQAQTKGTHMPATKASARHSAADMQAIKDTHDMAVGQGATCPTPEAKAGARHSAADVGHFQQIHDHAAALVDAAHCMPMGKAVGDLPATTDPSAPPPADDTGAADADEMSEDEGSPTVSIILPVPADVAAELAVSGGMDAATLALELLDLGDLSSLESQKFAILAAVEKVIAEMQPIDATVSAVGRNITPDADGMTPFYVLVDAPDLTELRNNLLDALSTFGIDADAADFTPRIELQDIGPDDPTPTTMPTVTDIMFDSLVVNFAGSPVTFPLGDPAADEAALEDEQDGGADDASEQPDGTLTKSVGDDTLIAYGGAIKSLPNGHVGGYLVRFSGPNDPDLTGDFFTKDTDFGFSPGETLKTAVYFNHRLPLKTRDGQPLTIKEKIGTGTLAMDDTGVFIDAVLYNREKYEQTLSSQGWSSGTASHLVDREPIGKSMWVKSWQLGLDASITPTPAEPRTRVLSLKSFLAETQPEARSQATRSVATGSAADDSDDDLPIIILRRRQSYAT